MGDKINGIKADTTVISKKDTTKPLLTEDFLKQSIHDVLETKEGKAMLDSLVKESLKSIHEENKTPQNATNKIKNTSCFNIGPGVGITD